MSKGYEKPVSERIADFLEYHKNGDGEGNGILLRGYCEKHSLSDYERMILAYFYAVTYCCLSAIVLLENVEEIKRNPVLFAQSIKDDLIFQSDRKYIKMRNCFEQTLVFFCKNQEEICTHTRTLLSCAESNFQSLVDKLSKWPQFGRFSAFLMIETALSVLGVEGNSGTIVWKDGNTATSGLLNLYGYDDAAVAFDKGRFKPNQAKMDEVYADLVGKIKAYHGDSNTSKVETSLCAYRKFYKESRYNGFYLDRILSELKALEPRFPEECKELYELRKELFPHEMLGELNDWNGIRPKEKKRYLLEGTMFGLPMTYRK